MAMTIHEWLHSAWHKGRALLDRRRLERDLDEELRFHLTLREERHLAAGLGTEEARYAASRRFGNVLRLKEECRDMWTFSSLEDLARDVRFAGRVLAKSPGLTAVAVLSLAIGIGGNAAMFSLVNAVLFRALPYPAADRLVRLTGFYPKGALVALREQGRTLEVAGASTDQEWNVTGREPALRLPGSAVSANLFSVLGRPAAVGRTFDSSEESPGHDRVVVLGHGLWEARFGSDPLVIGRSIQVEGVSREIVGVMPPGFHFPSGSTQLWVPLRVDSSNAEDYWGYGWMPLIARLRPGASLGQARAEHKAAVARVASMFPWPAPNWNADATVLPLQEDLVRDVRRKLLLLQSAVGLVLLIACTNVASLLLARAAARRKEMALRAALGASRGRIFRQLLTESLALSLLGGGLGVLLARAALFGLKAVLPADARGFSAVEIDGGVLLFVTGLSTLCGLLFGLAPALSASRTDLSGMVKAGGQRAAAPGSTRLRSSFVTIEVALAVVLAIGAGLLIRTLSRLAATDPGFHPEQTLTVRVSPEPATCEVRSACVAFYDELLRRAQELSGVSDVAAANAVPLGGEQPLLPLELEGHPLLATDAVAPLLWAGAVTPGYFRVMRIPLLQGRVVERTDAEATAPVAVVSASTARRYWPGENPIGKRLRVVWDKEWRTVVGVVSDVRHYALDGRSPAEITGAMYLPYPQAVALNRQIPRSMSLLLRSAGEPSDVAARLRALVAAFDPQAPVGEVRTLETVVASSIDEPRALMWLFSSFAGCALVLAAIGTYGVVSYSAAQRTYEIGVRVAVGATRGEILGLVMGQSVRLVLAGLGLGIGAALVLGRSLSGFLYGVSAADPLTLAAVVGLLLGTALLAGYLPGRRAAATDPARALRAD
jgi:putative ABC transport system permease protein